MQHVTDLSGRETLVRITGKIHALALYLVWALLRKLVINTIDTINKMYCSYVNFVVRCFDPV